MRLNPILLNAILVVGLSVISACAAGAGNVRGVNTKIELRGCENLGGNFAVPFSRAQTVLPQGFAPLPTTGGREAGAVFFVIAVRCTHGIVDGKDLGPSRIAYAELPVAPSDEFAVKGITDYTVPMAFMAFPKALAQAFSARGLAHANQADIVWEAAGTGGTRVRVGDGDAAFALRSVGPSGQASRLDAGRFVLFGIYDHSVTSALIGHSSAAAVTRVQVHLATGDAPTLLGIAKSSARGFSSTGFDLQFSAKPR